MNATTNLEEYNELRSSTTVPAGPSPHGVLFDHLSVGRPNQPLALITRLQQWLGGAGSGLSRRAPVP